MAGSRKPKIETACNWLQKMVRSEAALTDTQAAMFGGKYETREVQVGYCACVTCGVVLPYKTTWSQQAKGKTKIAMQGGHWIRRSATRGVLALCEDNVHPQCSVCNTPDKYGNGDGNKQAYDAFILHHLGIERMLELESLKQSPLPADEIVRLSDTYRKRNNNAEKELAKYAIDNE